LDTSRVLVAVILSLALIFAYQELVLKRMYPPPSQEAAQKPGVAKLPTALPSVPSAAASIAPGAAPSIAAAPGAAPSAAPAAVLPAVTGALRGAPTTAPVRSIEVGTDLYVAQFTTRGARLKSLKLKRYFETASPSSGWYEMVPTQTAGRLPLGVLLTHDGTAADDGDLIYSSSAPPKTAVAGDGTATITFNATTADGNTIEKSFTFKGGTYAFGMNVAVTGGRAPAEIGLALSQSLAEIAGGGYRDIPELQADISSKVITESESKLKKGVAPVAGPVTFAGFGDRYFFTAYLPETPKTATLAMSYENGVALARLVFRGTTRIESRVYAGPKLLDALEAVEPALNKAIDFGWTGIIALPFLRALKLFRFITPNWGWDIVLLTVALRVVFLPLSIRGQRSMLKMQRLQPQMERLREKFKEDQERLQREMVDLYKRNHVNPLGGCAPMALQMPIFIGLYEALLNAVELRHAPFMWWITDLSAPDCYKISWMPRLPYIDCHGLPVLVLLMGASTFLQQWMSPTSPDPNQQRMMMLTPIIFTVMFVNFPAGLSLYYFASNILGVIQQLFLNREFKQYTPAT
jgi:YidC/Oxa1 family membrane protein insertase